MGFQFNLPALLCQVIEPSWGSGWCVLTGYITCCTHPTCDISRAFFSLSDKGSCTHRNTDLAGSTPLPGLGGLPAHLPGLLRSAGKSWEPAFTHTPVLVPRPCSAIPPQLTVSHCFLVVLVYVLFECLFHLLPRTALSLLFVIIPSLFILTTNNVRDGALIQSPVHHET